VPTILGFARSGSLVCGAPQTLPGAGSASWDFGVDPSVTLVPGGGLKLNAVELGVDGSNEVKPTSNEGS
jgi:hypothetical protein